MQTRLINVSEVLSAVKTHKDLRGAPNKGGRRNKTSFLFFMWTCSRFPFFSCNNYCTSHSDRVNTLIRVSTQQQSRLTRLPLSATEARVGAGGCIQVTGSREQRGERQSRDASIAGDGWLTLHVQLLGVWCVVCGVCWEGTEKKQPSTWLKDAA